VTVAEAQRQIFRLDALADENAIVLVVRHPVPLPMQRFL
jgi:hypothetical protein